MKRATLASTSDDRPLDVVVRDVVATLLQPVVAEQQRQGAALDAIRQALARSHGPRDAADGALLLAIREAVGSRAFTARELVQHAAVDSALAAALLAADLVEAHDIGVLFRELQNVTIGGLRVERVEDSRSGVVWTVRL